MQYRLVEVRATNVKALKAVAIKPDGKPLFKVSGRNGQGKSSLLDAVAMALAGPEGFPDKPIRAGQDEASIYLDFTDLQLTRTIVASEDSPRGFTSALKLEFRNGKRPKQKQTELDALRGSPIADDPLEFASLKPRERYDLVRGLIPDFDFEANDEARRAKFEDRTDVGRQRDRAKAAAAAIVVPPDAPLELIDVTKAVQELQATYLKNRQIAESAEERSTYAEQLESLQDREAVLVKQLQELRGEIAEREKTIREYKPLPEPIDTAAIETRIRNAETINAGARRRQESIQRYAEYESLQERYDDLTTAIAALDQEKREAIEEAKLPIPELTLADGDVMLDGLPFDQASTARKIRVSTALLMALKPELRVLLVREGSLLDEDARAALEADAKEHGFVVLMECVGEDVAGGGVVIENGEVIDNA
jgi:energy-coupling factor transporter ATP-binding protein EcfA2